MSMLTGLYHQVNTKGHKWINYYSKLNPRKKEVKQISYEDQKKKWKALGKKMEQMQKKSS